MKLSLENDEDFESALIAIKSYMLSRTDTIATRKSIKIAINNLSITNDIIKAERNF